MDVKLFATFFLLIGAALCNDSRSNGNARVQANRSGRKDHSERHYQLAKNQMIGNQPKNNRKSNDVNDDDETSKPGEVSDPGNDNADYWDVSGSGIFQPGMSGSGASGSGRSENLVTSTNQSSTRTKVKIASTAATIHRDKTSSPHALETTAETKEIESKIATTSPWKQTKREPSTVFSIASTDLTSRARKETTSYLPDVSNDVEDAKDTEGIGKYAQNSGTMGSGDEKVRGKLQLTTGLIIGVTMVVFPLAILLLFIAALLRKRAKVAHAYV